jgi:hypothetical protein
VEGGNVKKILLIPLIVIIFILFGCQQNEESIVPVAQEVAQKLDTAQSQLSQGEITAGIESLLDAIILTNPRGYISDDFDIKIQEAKKEIQKKNMDETLDLISNARLLVVSQEIKQEKSVDIEPAPVAEAVKTLILDAKDQFQAGKTLEGVTSILAALLLFKPL